MRRRGVFKLSGKSKAENNEWDVNMDMDMESDLEKTTCEICQQYQFESS